MTTKIDSSHLERRAVVYLRQSTMKQLVENAESTNRQYALRDRAFELGWAKEQIDIVDVDLGHSGARAEGRVGFQRLGEDIAHGRVGAVFALEVSRLARSCTDWHHLLDLCGFADVVIADETAVYCPRDPNDRLVLGLKGTMSEAELTWMRLRLDGARLSKARRGALYLQPPAGYLWDSAIGRVRMDPDEQVQGAIRLVFEQFRATGSARGVGRYFVRQGLLLPAQGRGSQEVRWVPPKMGNLLEILHSPVYAGAYAFGRRPIKVRMRGGRMRQGRRRLAPDDWPICIRDHHPAYIEWEEFMANQRTLHDAAVSHGLDRRGGAPREGAALLQGIVLCGRCGHRMHPEYRGGSQPRQHRYLCNSAIKQGAGTEVCFSIAAAAIDAKVASLFLQAVQPPEIELALAVTRETERQSEAVAKQWQLGIDRAQYEARLAERRYKAVDPDNRVIARTLEREWNDKLVELQRLQHEQEVARQEKKIDLTEDDRATILALSRDLPRVWAAPTTTHNDRKNLVRLLVNEVSLLRVDLPERAIQIRILWHTGHVTEAMVPDPSQGVPRASPEAAQRIREAVSRNERPADIASDLNRRGLPTGDGRVWTYTRVRRFCAFHGIRWADRRRMLGRLRRADGLYSTRGVAQELEVTIEVVHHWLSTARLTAVEGGGQGRAHWFRLDDETRTRLLQLKSENAARRVRRSTPRFAPEEV